MFLMGKEKDLPPPPGFSSPSFLTPLLLSKCHLMSEYFLVRPEKRIFPGVVAQPEEKINGETFRP